MERKKHSNFKLWSKFFVYIYILLLHQTEFIISIWWRRSRDIYTLAKIEISDQTTSKQLFNWFLVSIIQANLTKRCAWPSRIHQTSSNQDQTFFEISNCKNIFSKFWSSCSTLIFLLQVTILPFLTQFLIPIIFGWPTLRYT